jgi:hypothetical protein
MNDQTKQEVSKSWLLGGVHTRFQVYGVLHGAQAAIDAFSDRRYFDLFSQK